MKRKSEFPVAFILASWDRRYAWFYNDEYEVKIALRLVRSQVYRLREGQIFEMDEKAVFRHARYRGPDVHRAFIHRCKAARRPIPQLIFAESVDQMHEIP